MKAITLWLGLCLLAAPVYAKKKFFGRVVIVKGMASRHSHTGKVFSAPIKPGEKIYQGNVITTDRNAFVKVIMKDNSVFQIGPNSSFAFVKDVNGKKKKSLYELIYGQFRAFFSKQKKGKIIKIKADSVTMGIRGTSVCGDVYMHNGRKAVDMCVEKGEVAIKANVDGKVHKFVMKKGDLIRTAKVDGGKFQIKQKIPAKLMGKFSNNKLFLRDILSSKKAKIQKEDVVKKFPQVLRKIDPMPVMTPFVRRPTPTPTPIARPTPSDGDQNPTPTPTPGKDLGDLTSVGDSQGYETTRESSSTYSEGITAPSTMINPTATTLTPSTTATSATTQTTTTANSGDTTVSPTEIKPSDALIRPETLNTVTSPTKIQLIDDKPTTDTATTAVRPTTTTTVTTKPTAIIRTAPTRLDPVKLDATRTLDPVKLDATRTLDPIQSDTLRIAP